MRFTVPFRPYLLIGIAVSVLVLIGLGQNFDCAAPCRAEEGPQLNEAAPAESTNNSEPVAQSTDEQLASPDKTKIPSETSPEEAGSNPECQTESDLLQQIITARLTAERLADLAEVITLCEQAIEELPDPADVKFAKYILAATLFQRAEFATKAIFGGAKGQVNRNWPSFRKLALADLEKAVQQVPEHPEALLLIARLNALPGGDANRAREAVKKGLAIPEADSDIRADLLTLQVGFEEDLEKKIRLLDESIELAPARQKFYQARALLKNENGQPEAAIDDLRKVIELAPDDPTAYEDLGRLLAQLKRYEEALEVLDRAEPLAGGSILSKVVRSRIFANQEKDEAALQQLNEAQKMQPGNPFVLLLRAGMLDEMEKPEEALKDVDQVLKLRPDNEQAIRYRVALLAKLKRINEAIDELTRLLEKKPNQPTLQLQLALLYTLDKKPQKAIDLYSQILEKDPKNGEALRGRANSYLGMGKHVEAVADFRRAYELDPDDPNMLNNYAWVLATSPEESIRDGQRAIELAMHACEITDYKEAHILSTLAAAYAESGDFENAMKWSQKAIDMGKEQNRQDIADALGKELENYQAKKPWRELLTEGLDHDSNP